MSKATKWRDASGNADRYVEPKQAYTLSTLGGFGMPERERDMQISVTLEACLCLTHALSGDCKAQEGKRIKCTLHQAGLADYLRK